MDAQTLQSIQDRLGLQVAVDEVETLLCKWYTITGPDGHRLAHIETSRAFPDDGWRLARVWASFQAINAEDAWAMAKLAEHVVDVAGRFEKARTDAPRDPVWMERRLVAGNIMTGDILVECDLDMPQVVSLPLHSSVVTATGVSYETLWNNGFVYRNDGNGRFARVYRINPSKP